LAKSAGIAPSYLWEIEAGRKPGSTRALAAIARTLRVAIRICWQQNAEESCRAASPAARPARDPTREGCFWPALPMTFDAGLYSSTTRGK
jgi:transcriptional regulator with XRE-family HTH domain